MKSIYKLFLFFTIIYSLFCFIDTEFIKINYPYCYNNQTLNNTKEFTLPFLHYVKDYYRIINFYGNLSLFNEDKTHNTTLDVGEKEYNFYRGEEFYKSINFTAPSPPRNCCFIVMNSMYKFDYDLTIKEKYLDLYHFEKREFNITIIKYKGDSKFISIYFEVFHPEGPFVDSVNVIDNEMTFVPIYEEIEEDNKFYTIFYLYFVRNLAFNIVLRKNQTSISSITITKINIANKAIENIANDGLFCSNRGINFYQMVNSNIFEYYLLSFKKDTELYFYKNNTNKEKINSGEIGKNTNDYFYLDKRKGGRCFYIKYTDKKNSIKEGNFNLTLFESSSYNFTVIDDNIKSIQITFKEDEYYSISYFIYQNIEINYLYKDEDNLYIYLINDTENESAFHLEFENISSIDSLDYHEVQLSYKSLNYTLKEITEDCEKNLTNEKMYIIYPQEKKQKVYIAHNSLEPSNFKINGKSQINNSFWITVNEINYLYVYGKAKTPLFFTLTYLEKDIIDLNLTNSFSFKLVTNQKLKFNFTVINKDFVITLRIYSKYKCFNSNITMEGAVSESGKKSIINTKENNTLIIKDEVVSAEIQFSLTNSAKIDEITISYNYQSEFEDIKGFRSYFFDDNIEQGNFYRLLLFEYYNYYEIINYYGNILLLIDYKLISNLTEGEQSYYFTYDTKSNYILKFSSPDSNQTNGFQIVCSKENRSNILTSYLVLYIFKEREFELIVKNETLENKLVSIKTNISSSSELLEINKVTIVENETEFEPLSYLNNYYLILDKNLTFKIRVSKKNRETKESIPFEIKLLEKLVNTINESKIINPPNDITFYNILNSNDFKNYYSLYFKSEIKNNIYYYENNTDIKKANSNERKRISDYELLYYNYSKSSNSFYIEFQDEINTIEKEYFSIILYEPIQYNFTLVNNNEKARRIQIKYKNNKYYNISNFIILEQNKEIKYLFLDLNNYYIYQFNKTSDKIPITLNFSEKEEYLQSIEITFTYYSFNNDMIKINKDYPYNCITSEEMYEIQYNKLWFEILFNTSSFCKVILNNKCLDGHIFMPSFYNNYLNILGSPEEKICFQITYYESNYIELKLEQELNFIILMNQYYYLRIYEFKEDNDIELYIKTENDNLQALTIRLLGFQDELLLISKKGRIYNCTIIKPYPSYPYVDLALTFIPYNKINKEKVTVYYKLIQKTDVFVSFVCYYTYAALGLFVLSLIYYAIEKSRGKTKKDIHISYYKVFKRFGNLCKIKRKNNQLNKLV